MRAIEFHGGERIELVERPDPTPGEGELLIAPTAVGICGTDVEIFEGSMAYFRDGFSRYPIVPGHEWTGVVVDVGPHAGGFAPGDRVVGEVAIGCGHCVRCRAGRPHVCANRTETGIVRMDGAMASRLVFPAGYAHKVDLEPRAAALVEPTAVALHAARRAQVAGQGVLIVGAGPIGLLSAECARAEGADSVWVTDTRADRRQAAEQLGFRADTPHEDEVDVVILCAGGPAAIAAALDAVRPSGRIAALGLSGAPAIAFGFDALVTRDIDLIGVLGSVGYWEEAIGLIEQGSVRTEPLVSGAFALENTRDALEHLASPGSLKVLIEP